MNEKTDIEHVVDVCRTVFESKQKKYGTSWRVMRYQSLTDQIYIKINRIRNIQITGHQKVDDDIKTDFIGIINYSVMAIIQLHMVASDIPDLTYDESMLLYDENIKKSIDIMSDKNHDYGEVWRRMRVSSFVDIIMMKIMRIKQIEDTDNDRGSLFDNYVDILNYSIFAVIDLS